MSNELNFRTEDLTPEEIDRYFIETPADRATIDAIKTKKTVVIQGARGVGKSFLLHVAKKELDESFESEKVLAVYVTLNKASLLKTSDSDKFKHWMLAKICNRVMRAARKKGLIRARSTVFSSLAPDKDDDALEPRLEQLEERLEESWRSVEPVKDFDSSLDPESITDAIEDLCQDTGLRRVVLLVDEAAHVFIPNQQRQFFTLMRDLRTPYLSVKAAVYPGVTYFGDSFQMRHDAELIDVNRDILEPGYLSSMREMVVRQDPSLESVITKYGEAFDALAFSASGNPRILLKTVSSASPFNNNNVQKVMREYYRDKIWSEHSELGNRYAGHRKVIDWGREFITGVVLPYLDEKSKDKESLDTRIFLWIHRDAPAAVKEALRLLCYSGILHEEGSGLVATRGHIGTRYMLNIGTRTGRQRNPVAFCTELRRSVSIKLMVEYGANNRSYAEIEKLNIDQLEDGFNELLNQQLRKSVDALDLTFFLRNKLKELNFDTVEKALAASEEDFMRAKGIGPVRSRHMMNAATAAVLEYLSG
ncbi:AAA family ATPase [Saccharopolyspora sp. NPDC050642]|uniref:ORC-CDC6 family AAA ATPase n=1 Tax=Saccharopolyspora sp. NPDC050642 TaxID=3157099 RepID=UPI0033E06187